MILLKIPLRSGRAFSRQDGSSPHKLLDLNVEVAHTVRDARRYPGALAFIVASFLYQDAIGTIVSFMAIYAVKAMGFRQGSEITLFLVLTIPAIFVGWPGIGRA